MRDTTEDHEETILVWNCVNKSELDNYLKGLVTALERNKQEIVGLTEKERGLLQEQIDNITRIIDGLESGEWDLKYSDARSVIDTLDVIAQA
jgi:hypothetical protein